MRSSFEQLFYLGHHRPVEIHTPRLTVYHVWVHWLKYWIWDAAWVHLHVFLLEQVFSCASGIPRAYLSASLALCLLCSPLGSSSRSQPISTGVRSPSSPSAPPASSFALILQHSSTIFPFLASTVARRTLTLIIHYKTFCNYLVI